MRILVTGGSGYVGRHLLRVLQERGHEVVALARSDESARCVEALGATSVLGDLRDPDSLAPALEGCEGVIHAAALMKLFGRYEFFHQHNVLGTEALLAAAKAAGVRRFVQIGAAAVVKHRGPVVDADETWKLRTPHYAPYIASKTLAETKVRAAATEKFASLVVRPPLIWGGEEGSLLPGLIQRVRDGRWRWIDGGHYRYSTCHVRNVSEGAVLALERGRGGEAYFLRDAEDVELREFFTALLATQGVTPSDHEVSYRRANQLSRLLEGLWWWVGREPPFTRLQVRLLGCEFTVSDAKAREELGYLPVVSLEEGLAELRELAHS